MRDPRKSLCDILKYLYLIETSAAGQSIESLSQDRVKRAAIERWLIIVSEAVFRLGLESEEGFHRSVWSDICDFGNVLCHDYDKVDVSQLWGVVTQELGPLKQSVTDSLASLDEEQ